MTHTRIMRTVSASILAISLFAHFAKSAHAETLSVERAMNAIVTRLYESHSLDELAELDESKILAFITPAERQALATRHVHFEVDVPVVVSVMREARQRSVPFWLEEAGFEKTELTVTNTEDWVYEMWQKTFPAGHVGLGINGFGNHRPHYFVSVGPVNPDDDVELRNLVPSEFDVGWMHEGAFVYHDWDSLLLKDVPEVLEGQLLLTTIRGRARAAHLIGGFRQTPHPSSDLPDQVVLSWTEAPTSTQTIQWRGSTDATNGAVRYRAAGSDGPYKTVEAERALVEDRFLANDRYCRKFTATIRGLDPDSQYVYQVGFPDSDRWSEASTFTTAPSNDEPFSFVVFGDTQSIEPLAPIAQAALEQYPDAAFQMIAGDVVSTGQYRDHWDRFFHVAQPLTRRWPLMPALGNHDVIDGLGADMWRAAHALPENGPEGLEPERAYAFEYSNALFVVLDSGLSAVDQAQWLEEQLASTDADWKIVIFHFPPYNHEHPYPEIASLWGYLFDKYEVDLAFEGHVHYYMRSKPIYRGKPMPEGERGTTHVVTIAIPNEKYQLPPADYAAVQLTGVALYQAVEVNGNTLTCRAVDANGKVHDAFTLTKSGVQVNGIK